MTMKNRNCPLCKYVTTPALRPELREQVQDQYFLSVLVICVRNLKSGFWYCSRTDLESDDKKEEGKRFSCSVINPRKRGGGGAKCRSWMLFMCYVLKFKVPK